MPNFAWTYFTLSNRVMKSRTKIFVYWFPICRFYFIKLHTNYFFPFSRCWHFLTKKVSKHTFFWRWNWQSWLEVYCVCLCKQWQKIKYSKPTCFAFNWWWYVPLMLFSLKLFDKLMIRLSNSASFSSKSLSLLFKSSDDKSCLKLLAPSCDGKRQK